MRPWITELTDHPLPRFIVVGGFAFLIDAALLAFLSLFLNLALARLFSFLFVATGAWALNRRFTFQSKDPSYKKEWMRYTFIASLAGSINYFSFLTLIYSFHFLHQHPILALAMATVASALFNFYFSRHYSFKSSSKCP